MWALPQISAAVLNRGLKLHLEVQSPGFQAITGAFKLFIVVGYMMLLRRMRETRRVFQYHGAEHKTISTYEANEELTVANARTKTTLHPRCGTTFLVMVVLMSIAIFTALATSWTLFSGPTNYISLATAAFFGIGMYIVAGGIKILPYPVLVLLSAFAGAAFAGFFGVFRF